MLGCCYSSAVPQRSPGNHPQCPGALRAWSVYNALENEHFCDGLMNISVMDLWSVSPFRKRAERRHVGKAVEWRSWRTGPTWMALGAVGSTLTRFTTSGCTSPAGSAPSCPRQLCASRRSPGMLILTQGQGKTGQNVHSSSPVSNRGFDVTLWQWHFLLQWDPSEQPEQS